MKVDRGRIVKLGDLVEDIRYGLNGSANFQNNGIKFLRITDIDENGNIDYEKLPFVNVTRNEAERYLLKEGDCVIARSGSVGKAHIFRGKKDVAYASYLIRLRFRNDLILPLYFGAFSKTKIYWNQIVSNTKGGVQQNINTEGLSRIKIPLPSLPIQKQIAEILEKAEQAKQERQEANKLTEQFLQSAFIEMFGEPIRNQKKWEKKNIIELANVKTGGTPSRKIDRYFNGNIPWVKTTEVNNNIIIYTEEKISDEALKNSNCVIFPKDTVLIALYGQGLTRGRTALLGINACTNQACGAILPSPKINSIFLWHQLRHYYLFLRDLSRGGNQPNLNLTFIKELKIIYPPLSLQEVFAELVQKVENLKEKQKDSEKELDNLFNGLMQKAFNGDLF